MAFLADVHGNLPALEAVLDELARRAITEVFVAGDLLLGGDDPLEVWQRLSRLGARCVLGPSDAALGSIDPDALRPDGEEERSRAQLFRDTQRALGDVVCRRVSTLPRQMRLPMLDGRELLLVHGSPRDPFEPISHDLDDDAVLELLDDDVADVVICGATHVPFERIVEGIEVINVGSVGEAPEGRVAHYTVLSPRVDGATVEQTWVEY